MKVSVQGKFIPHSSSSLSYGRSSRSRAKGTHYSYRILLSILAPSCIFTLLLMLGWIHVIAPAVRAQQKAEAHPTVLPWLQTQAACEATKRVWREDGCWDQEHSPDF